MSDRNRKHVNASDEEVETDAQTAGYDTDEEGGLRIDDDIYIPSAPRKLAETDNSAPRLMITQIVNENFKSYAGKQVIGPFHKCFSAIVGPNGSGKSNVIDSMLFVFGYRANKIRSKKISVLIHNSSQHPNINSCTVSVHFQKIIDKSGTDYDVVPNSEFVISRTAFKDNSSYYELNKRKVQFKEISKLLRSYGVDLDHNRFLILQGEVEQIAMMKPKGQNENDTGMLEFLEDIIGTVRYREPLEKLLEKVEILAERKVEKLNRLRAVEHEKDALKEPMQEAVQFLQLENSIKKLQYELYHCKRYTTKNEFSAQEEKVKEISTDCSNLINEMKSVQEAKQEKTKQIKEKSKAWDAIQAQKDEISAKFDKVRKKDESLHAELVETNKRRKDNIAAVKKEKNKLEELLKVPEKSAKDIEECEALIKRETVIQEKEEKVLATLMSGLEEKTKPLLDKRSKLENELISLRKNVDNAKSSYDIAQSELDIFTSVEKTEREKTEKLKDNLQSVSTMLKERKQQLASLDKKIPASEKSLKQAETELDGIKREETEAMNNLKRMRISFEEQRTAMQVNKSRNRVLDALMREKREGRLSGILGRLGDLGAIDAKYDVAISTACGPLDNIVVDTVATAQACIAFLRQNNIGRGTFIPLEKQQRFLHKCKERIETPENVPRLFDLIKVENESILPAFYYGLHDTLVAQDLEQATRVAYGRINYRVVTLKGELIELSGTMSGGGRTVLKGRMGQRVVKNDVSAESIEKLQSELDREYEKCNHLKAKQHTLENQIHTLSMALKDMEVDKKKFNIEVQALVEQEPALRSQLKIQEVKCKGIKSDPQKISQLNKMIEEADKHLQKVKQESEDVEHEVEQINKKINDISGNRVKEQQKKIANFTKSIDKAKAEICRLQVHIKTTERNVKKTEQRIETLENDVCNCEQRLRDIQQEKAQLEDEAKAYLTKIDELTENLKERDETVESFNKELNALQAREDKMKSLKIDLDQKMKENKKILEELKQKIADYSARIAGIKLHVIPGEQVGELIELTEDEIKELDEKDITRNLQRVNGKLPSTVPNMQFIKDYQEKDELYIKRAGELQEITTQYDKLREILEMVRRRRIQEFLNGFSIITDKLKEMYQMITLGGDAELELVDSLDPFSEGIVFSVRPPKKSWKNISNLSGGEKTLSSLALVFALHHYKPTPVYFMDEIDAALDFKNVSIVGNYIKERTKNAQFIVISLRSNMFELADYLVGIYKTSNCTKSITVHLDQYYTNNDIAPPLPLTSKSLYGTQKSTESQCPSQCKECSLPKSNTAESQANASLNLPELGLCPTPTKKSVQRASTQNETVSQDITPSKEPCRKKRKK